MQNKITMRLNLNSLQKRKDLTLYIVIGIINTIFAYINGIFFFKIFYIDFGALLVTTITSVTNIFFAFVNYKIFYFKTHKKYFFKEYLRMNIYYFFILILNSIMLWVLIEKININIYITQSIIIILNIFISTVLNFKYVFKIK